MSGSKKNKQAYFERLLAHFEEYPRIVLATCDNIGSSHMQNIRKSLRGKGELLMGKNTLIRKALRLNAEEHPDWVNIVPHIKQNVGLVFTKQELGDIKDVLLASKVPAAAKAGAVAPNDVVVPAGITNLEPTKTSFFAALDIATKITRGNVEIISDVALIKSGEKVGNSQAALLQMLGIKPFEYGLKLTQVYDNGSIFPASLLDRTVEGLLETFAFAVSRVASVSLGVSYPTLPALPHVVSRAYKNLLGVVLETDYVFEQAKELKELISNPEALAAAQAQAQTAETTQEEKKEEPEEEEEESEEMMGGFFDM
jgi:large subunit ribosomal protein LP0